MRRLTGDLGGDDRQMPTRASLVASVAEERLCIAMSAAFDDFDVCRAKACRSKKQTVGCLQINSRLARGRAMHDRVQTKAPEGVDDLFADLETASSDRRSDACAHIFGVDAVHGRERIDRFDGNERDRPTPPSVHRRRNAADGVVQEDGDTIGRTHPDRCSARRDKSVCDRFV